MFSSLKEILHVWIFGMQKNLSKLAHTVLIQSFGIHIKWFVQKGKNPTVPKISRIKNFIGFLLDYTKPGLADELN